MVSVMFIGGIPWPEALEGQPFSRDVESNVLLSHSQSKWDQLKDLHRVT